MGSHLFGSNHMSLGLSQLGSHQISPLQNQNPPSSNMLRLGSAGGAKFEHLIPPSNPSSFGQAPQPMHSSALFMPDANQGFPNKPMHGLMQLPDLQSNSNNSPPASSLFNLSFFPNNNSSSGGISSGDNVNMNSTSLPSSGLLLQDQINNSMGDHGVSSLYSNSMPPENIASHMSATALLQKAAQMGSTTSSNSSSLFRGLTSSSSIGAKSEKQNVLANFGVSFGNDNGGESLRSQIENGNNLQGLMNSIANANPSMFGGSGRGQDNNFVGFNGGGVTLDQHHSNTNFSSMDEAKLHQNLAVSFGGSDKLTLDFLGVGGMVRNMGGGYSQREQQHAINMSSLESDLKSTAQASQPFGSTTLQ